MNILDWEKAKKAKKPLTMLTCYDYAAAKLISQQVDNDGCMVDSVLVGDSVAMVVHGHDNTLQATTEMMVMHTEAVARGLKGPFLVADMPFMSYRCGLEHAAKVATKLMRAGAHALKLEGADGNVSIIKHLVVSGIPVMGHLGLTPQSVHQLGGFKVQGRDREVAQKVFDDAKALADAGCFSLVLECVPEALARQVSEALDIPVIGIGAGRYVDGQVLVWHDLLGLASGFQPKFLQTFASGGHALGQGIQAYCQAVRQGDFPGREHVYQPEDNHKEVSSV
jgi:3-methyl-2-oxobutanoate hydroxymethyltransferase